MFSFRGLCHLTPTGALPLDPTGGLRPPDPLTSFPPYITNFPNHRWSRKETGSLVSGYTTTLPPEVFTQGNFVLDYLIEIEFDQKSNTCFLSDLYGIVVTYALSLLLVG